MKEDSRCDATVIVKCPNCEPHPKHGQPDCISEWFYHRGAKHRRDMCLVCGWLNEYHFLDGVN